MSLQAGTISSRLRVRRVPRLAGARAAPRPYVPRSSGIEKSLTVATLTRIMRARRLGKSRNPKSGRSSCLGACDLGDAGRRPRGVHSSRAPAQVGWGAASPSVRGAGPRRGGHDQPYVHYGCFVELPPARRARWRPEPASPDEAIPPLLRPGLPQGVQYGREDPGLIQSAAWIDQSADHDMPHSRIIPTERAEGARRLPTTLSGCRRRS